MRIPRSVLVAAAALLVASGSSAQQDILDANADMNSDAAAVDPISAVPVGFFNMGRGRVVPITSSEYESIERGEWPNASEPGEELNPDVAAPAFGAAAVISEDEKNSVLNAHNTLRAKHGAPALTWNTEAAKYGDNWLQSCKFEHSFGKYGENLAAGHKDFPSTVQGWYNESKDYKFNDPGFFMRTFHFTQLVWKSSKTVGCAKKVCPTWTMYICEYDPPGNIASIDNSYFTKNVLPLGTKA
ncbi:hypothetical protein BGZ96_009703 [Linnemannia gamsii]|uniref:SCP domain-containing protein n=1 Tax=Linnemannia gamsii TaxID=64522 RepID=A0ABQ7KHB8_9FUNG|nr:hypothetical protein BGZ96_009703 [Linnemannia gamsii]